MNILYVDDEIELLELTQLHFKDQGLTLDTAASAAEAIKLYSNKNYQIIISDAKMPKMNGHELYRELRATHHFHGKFLLITGNDIEVEESSTELPYDRIVYKPITAEKLCQIVKELSQNQSNRTMITSKNLV